MLLHNDKDLFKEVIYSTSAELGLPVPIVEKDYYVTVILKELSEKATGCVFKGGTVLSKCYHAIDRFSEDIDIAFSNKLTQGERKKLKNKTIAGISADLGLPIVDWEKARSRRDYNCYTFSYSPIEGAVPDSLIQGVKMEVALGSISFPTVLLDVDSYVYQYLSRDNMDIANEYGLRPFPMTLQTVERTFVDKVFAVCDYYMQGRLKRHSRHLYDIYMLFPMVKQDKDLKILVHQVRGLRADMAICPSAKAGIDIPGILKRIIEEKVYMEDYESITSYFQNQPLVYDKAITALAQIAESDIFEEK